MEKDRDEYWHESEPEHDSPPSYDDDHESPYYYGYGAYYAPAPSYGYVPHGVVHHHKVMKKIKKYYHPPYVAHHPYGCPPVVCDPHYVVKEHCVPREVPVVHPIIYVHKHKVVNVPKHYYKPVKKHMMVDPGCPCPPHLF
ncbi:MAG: hypothetical protein K6T63_10770 [Alicyclobacillus herbarius]|uniref:hypothetical protein n=1 Tax=Alicyclobacillus herbarius TaxID=122960 RepID=UPI0003F7BAEA|nr:hypothetical protein [Alicyclobacillus herbarius]MCL6633102.1 hypothetical protein [Alicyclobacillus herbarius]